MRIKKYFLRSEARARVLVKRAINNRPKPTLQEKFPQYEIGRASYGIPSIRSWGGEQTLKIGAFCSISERVQIFLGGEHRHD